ncbi:hypothetical protein ACWGN9_13040 [Streptomyces sp. NPDC055775]
MVDTLGLLLGVMVTAAHVGDRAAAHILLEQVAAAHHRLAGTGGCRSPSPGPSGPTAATPAV